MTSVTRMNHYYTDAGSKWITTAQTLAPNESLQRRLWLQMNHYCPDSDSKWITTTQTLAQMDHYCSDSGSKWITTTQTLAQMNHYYADSGSKWITTAQTLDPNESLQHRHITLQPKTVCPLKLSRVEPGQYLDGRPPRKTRLLLEEVLVRPAGGAHRSAWVLMPQCSDRDTTLSKSTVFRMRR